MSDSDHRKFVYKYARAALKRSASKEEVRYALELLEPLNGHKALGLKVRLTRKAEGLPWSWDSIKY